jgi:hypothetical protein
MIVRIHTRLRPAPDHAYVVPVVRELPPPGRKTLADAQTW